LRQLLALALLTLGAWTPAGARAAAAIESYAFVNDDATLEVRNRRIRLHGIYVPPSPRTCRGNIHPVRCGSQAVLALEFKIQGFVRCHPVQREPDGSLSAVCYCKGEDLGAYLLSRGWAVARPGAPFEYEVLERIARERQVGVWAAATGPFVFE
jgi:endonuclease YncB( thermonuclease family)